MWLVFFRIPNGPLSERESSRHRKTKLGSCPSLCRVRPIHFSEMTGGRPVQMALYGPTVQGEKNIRVMVPLVSLNEGLVLVGRGARLSGEGIARSGQITVKPPMSRLGRAGEDPLRFRALVLARERRAEVLRFQRQFCDLFSLFGPSGASGLAVNVVGWQGQEPSRFEPAAPEQGCQVWQLEGGRPKHRPPNGRSGPPVSLFRVFWWGNSTPTAGRNWVPAAVTSRWGQGFRYFRISSFGSRTGMAARLASGGTPALGCKH